MLGTPLGQDVFNRDLGRQMFIEVVLEKYELKAAFFTK